MRTKEFCVCLTIVQTSYQSQDSHTPKLAITKLSILGCTILMGNRDRYFNKLETKAMEKNVTRFTEGGNGNLVFIPNLRKVMAVRDVITKENEVGSIPDNAEKPDLLDEEPEQQGIWYPDDGH